MIVVFVIDTSPSMRKRVRDAGSGGKSKGMTRLDLAKMATEEIVKGLKKRIHEHNVQLHQAVPKLQESLCNIGLGYSPKDELLLLSTGRQHASQSAIAACGAGGRLLVGFGDHLADENNISGNSKGSNSMMEQAGIVPSSQQHGIDNFQKELKQLTATDWIPLGKQQQQGKKPKPFPEDGGGAIGLNAALSTGLQMLSRYRLRFKATENFGMGRLPSSAILNPSGGGTAIHALQPACLILITDGECLRAPPVEGGGSLQLNSSSLLRDFYREPFRWDQRIFCLGVGGRDGITSSQLLHPSLRALCEVTGGCHMMLTQTTLSRCSDMLVKVIAPPRPRALPLKDPMEIPPAETVSLNGSNGTFLNGGPVCTFQPLEPDLDSEKAPAKMRAMLLYAPQLVSCPLSWTESNVDSTVFQPPIWCIPEAYFPSKSLKALPPRFAQPNLIFSRYPSRLGSKCFEASLVMKLLHKLDQIMLASRKLVLPSANGLNQQARFLQRDVYICEWLSVVGPGATGPTSPPGMEYYPVMVAGAGNPHLSSGEANFMTIGILHVPSGTSTLSSSLSAGVKLSTLTLMPPEPHVLLPLLIRAAEVEYRALKKIGGSSDNTVGMSQKQAIMASRSVQLDENWRNEFRAYLFRLPPYYQSALKRTLRNILPSSGHSLLHRDDVSLWAQCYAKECQQKIRNAEQIAKTSNERLERQEAELRRRAMSNFLTSARADQQQVQHQAPNGKTSADNALAPPTTKYGHYDPRSSVESYLAALRNLPAPWKSTGRKGEKTSSGVESNGIESTKAVNLADRKDRNAMDALKDLPANCLMAFYESRRRWIFGGSGLSTRGLFVEGVNNDGSNVQHCAAKRDIMNESVLSFAGVGVRQMNSTTTAKMGDYRERLLWSRAPVVGYGANDSIGVSATTSQNGAPIWSVDDDAMPVAFFDARTGEFSDSVQARVRSRLFVNFGNPYKDKRADSLIPEQYLDQRPKLRYDDDDDGNGPMTPPTSPPHDSYAASDGEGEAVFATSGKPTPRKHSRKSPSRDDEEIDKEGHSAKRQRTNGDPRGGLDDKKESSGQPKRPPPPPSLEKEDKSQGKVHPPPPSDEAKAPPSQPPKQVQNRKMSLPRPPPASAATTSASAASQPKRPPPPPGHRRSSSSSRPAPPPQSTSAAPKPPVSLPSPAPTPQLTAQSAPIDMASPEKKPNVDLPSGWMCVWSKSQKRWYFFDTKTNKSVWQWPPP